MSKIENFTFGFLNRENAYSGTYRDLELIEIYTYISSLELIIIDFHRTTAGYNSFSSSASKLWNSLPTHIKEITLSSFKALITLIYL